MNPYRPAGLQAWRKVYRFRATSRAGNAKGRKIALPALLYSRLTALRSLLSVALSSARQFDSITRIFLCQKWTCFQN
jgi:hypothetical protein